ncbi:MULTISPECIES: DUF1905 domain-containing protein [Micromonospora]|nr:MULTISPECIES: DUF1905 domain-containing protein [unclassified Micromonospora]MBM0224960.1 DUF1905 domain-containing protein [Micromonospora sp. ATA51]
MSTVSLPGGGSAEGAPVAFEATLVRWPGPGGWVFAPVPDEYAPPTAGPFGRVPVTATVDARTWSTSVWRDRRAGWLLAVPARIRAGKDHGDVVSAAVEVDHARM